MHPRGRWTLAAHLQRPRTNPDLDDAVGAAGLAVDVILHRHRRADDGAPNLPGDDARAPARPRPAPDASRAEAATTTGRSSTIVASSSPSSSSAPAQSLMPLPYSRPFANAISRARTGVPGAVELDFVVDGGIAPAFAQPDHHVRPQPARAATADVEEPRHSRVDADAGDVEERPPVEDAGVDGPRRSVERGRNRRAGIAMAAQRRRQAVSGTRRARVRARCSCRAARRPPRSPSRRRPRR